MIQMSGELSYCFIIESTEAIHDFCYHRGPGDDIFTLGVWTKFVIIPNHPQAKTTIRSQQWIGVQILLTA